METSAGNPVIGLDSRQATALTTTIITSFAIQDARGVPNDVANEERKKFKQGPGRKEREIA
eukprot:794790-Amorphochlora_amoeboformis.AAC.1